ncbi:MAG: hypothetical protein ACQEVA_14270 [Myxococcota bacterium]
MMHRFMLMLALLFFPLPLVAQDRYADASSGASDDSDQTKESQKVTDVSGTWAQKVVNSSISKVPVVGEVTTDSVGYLLLDIQQDGDDLTITSELCDVRIDSSVKKVRTVVPQSFVEAIGTTTRRAELDREDGQWNFVAPTKYTTLGVRLRNEQHETLPEDPDDPRVLDPDDDGKPGVTLRIEGMISGELYVIQRGWDVMRGTVDGQDRIDGLIEWGNEQVLLDSSSVFLGSQPPSRPHPNAKRSFFRTTRMPDDATCSDLVESRKTLFSRP